MGDWCGGPVEPVDGSWHVAWRLLNSANPEQLHTEMPVFAGGRYEREDEDGDAVASIVACACLVFY